MGFDAEDDDAFPRREGAGVERACPTVGSCAELQERECFAGGALDSWRQNMGDKSPKSKERGKKQKTAVKAKSDKEKADRTAAKAKKL
jgi:hypothetical protein